MSDLEDLDGSPFAPGRSGEDREGGAGSGGGSIGTLVSSGNAPSPKRRGRPPSSARILGSNPPQSGGASAAASDYLRAAGLGVGTSASTDGDTGTGIGEEDGSGRGSGEGAEFPRPTTRRQSTPEPVPLPVAGAKRGRPRKVDVTEVEEKHVAHGICAIFGGIFTLLTVFDASHPHKHWIKTTDKVRPISEPTTDWLNTLGEDARRRVQGCLIPAAILGGIAQVVGPDIQIEMEMRRLERAAMRGMPIGPPRGPNAPPVEVSPTREPDTPVNGVDGPSLTVAPEGL